MNVAHNHCQIAPINPWVKQKSRVHLLKFLKYLVMSCNIIATLKYKLNAVQFYTKDLLKKLMFKLWKDEIREGITINNSNSIFQPDFKNKKISKEV